MLPAILDLFTLLCEPIIALFFLRLICSASRLFCRKILLGNHILLLKIDRIVRHLRLSESLDSDIVLTVDQKCVRVSMARKLLVNHLVESGSAFSMLMIATFSFSL